MKLRNKKTGEIKDVESLGHEKSLREKYGPQITLSWDTEYKNLGECRTYNSLAELNEEWEDYEEPKEYYYLDNCGDILQDVDDDSIVDRIRKEIGNHFETKEEAEKAVEKLKAWTRLTNHGLCLKLNKFQDLIKYEFKTGGISSDYDAEEALEDIDFLFGKLNIIPKSQ